MDHRAAATRLAARISPPALFSTPADDTMSTHSGGSRSSRRRRASSPPAADGSSPPAAPTSVPRHIMGSESGRSGPGAMGRGGPSSGAHPRALRGHGNNVNSTTRMGSTSKPSSRAGSQRTPVMARNREVRVPAAVDIEDSVSVSVTVVGVQLQCSVVADWPCESLIAAAMEKYHNAFPTCEIPDSNRIFHNGRKEQLPLREPIGKWCRDGDALELGVGDRLVPSQHVPPVLAASGETYDFMIIFHRLPLGFTLRQENDVTVVANIYPRSAATHYERLVPGVTVVSIGDTPLEQLGLRQVHELIKTSKIPLHILFRGWKKPKRRPSLGALPTTSSAMMAAPAHPTSQSSVVDVKEPTPAPRVVEQPSSAAAEAGIPALFESAVELAGAGSSPAHTPSPYSQSKQRVMSERKKTNASSPYPEHRAVVAGRRNARTARESSIPKPSHAVAVEPQVPDTTNQNQSHSPSENGSLSNRATDEPTVNAQASPNPAEDAENRAMEDVTKQLSSTNLNSHAPTDTRADVDMDSNQNEDETEEMLEEHVRILQEELRRKEEEVRALATQLARYRNRLTAARHKRNKKAPPVSAPASLPSTQPQLRLTPAVLHDMDSKAGLPPKSAGHYEASESSSISGVSYNSNRSAALAARRNAQLSRYVGRTGQDSMQCDASVSSCNSSSSQRRNSHTHGSVADALKSPRRKCLQNVNSRYNYMPPKYSATSQYYDAPSSFSTKGAVMSRAKITRDSFITIPDSPGVGAYDVKLHERVRGGEIGDSDRSLPWSKGS
ncbi:hypothetical protein ATCC90586_009449 [Pythium insidiosum]|nr:hypothetical protein ATCC90586_009449 [Pythium insidiosum]